MKQPTTNARNRHGLHNMAVLLLLLPLIVPAVSAVTFETETFDTDNVGTNPTAPWYTYNLQTTNGATTGIKVNTAEASMPGQNPAPGFGSGKWYEFDSQVGSGGQQAAFILAQDYLVSEIQFDFTAGWGLGGVQAAEIFARDSEGRNILRWTADNTTSVNRCQLRITLQSCAAGGIFDGDSWKSYATINVTFDWLNKTYDVYANGTFAVTGAFISNAAVGINRLIITRPQANIATMAIDNFWMSVPDDGFEIPKPPAGITALVNSAATMSGDAQITLRWPLSPNDPNRAVGAFDYQVYVNGVSVGFDATTAEDGDGYRVNVQSIGGGGAGGFFDFKVKARNATVDLFSVFSCTVSVDISVVGDSATCGTVGSPNIGATPAQNPNNPIGLIVNLASESWGFDFAPIIGLVVILGLTYAGAKLGGTGLAIIFGLVGVVGAIVVGFFAEWVALLLALGFILMLVARRDRGGGED